MVPDLLVKQRIHIIAVGGAAMSAVAHILHRMGHDVTGSDQSDSDALRALATEGINVWTPHDAARIINNVNGERNVPSVAAISAAVKPGNVELDEITDLGIPVASRADMMQALGALRRTIAVSGTAGKTTTSAMMATIAIHAGWNPSMIVGSRVHGIDTGVAWNESPWFVVEADESDGSFLRFSAEAVIVNNLEEDHLDYWITMERLEAAFDQFVSLASGPKVVSADDAGCGALLQRIGASEGLVTFGFDEAADYHIENFVAEGLRSSFDVRTASGRYELALAVPGKHNAMNATAAFAMALELGIDARTATEALGAFQGTARRFEYRGTARGVTFVDDYSHLPGKAKAAVEGALLGGWKRLVAVYQPHRFTRTRDVWRDYADSFVGADLVIITAIYSAGQEPIPGISGELIVQAIREAHPDQRVEYCATRNELHDLLATELRDGDLCLTMNAGDLTTLPDEMLASAWATAG